MLIKRFVLSLTIVVMLVSPACSVPIKPVIKISDDVIEAIIDVFRKTKNLPRPMRALDIPKNLPPHLNDFILKLLNESPGIRRVVSGELISLANHNPNLIESLFKLSIKYPNPNCGKLLTILRTDSPKYFDKAVIELTDNFSDEALNLFFRTLDQKPVSSKQIETVVDAFRNTDDGGQLAGQMFEAMSRRKLPAGNMRQKTGLQRYSNVFDGQWNGVNGIDGIGIGIDGRPVIFEFTIDKSKNLAKTKQLSPEWCADRWNKLVAAKPELEAQLIASGMERSCWKSLTPIEAGKLKRFLIASDAACLNEANRLASRLGPNDLLVLGD
jgi:hypothetical protein